MMVPESCTCGHSFPRPRAGFTGEPMEFCPSCAKQLPSQPAVFELSAPSVPWGGGPWGAELLGLSNQPLKRAPSGSKAKAKAKKARKATKAARRKNR